MLTFLFTFFSHLRSQYGLLAYGPTLLTILAVVFFGQETLTAKLAVFLIIASLVSYISWGLFRE